MSSEITMHYSSERKKINHLVAFIIFVLLCVITTIVLLVMHFVCNLSEKEKAVIFPIGICTGAISFIAVIMLLCLMIDIVSQLLHKKSSIVHKDSEFENKAKYIYCIQSSKKESFSTEEDLASQKIDSKSKESNTVKIDDSFTTSVKGMAYQCAGFFKNGLRVINRLSDEMLEKNAEVICKVFAESQNLQAQGININAAEAKREEVESEKINAAEAKREEVESEKINAAEAKREEVESEKINAERAKSEEVESEKINAERAKSEEITSISCQENNISSTNNPPLCNTTICKKSHNNEKHTKFISEILNYYNLEQNLQSKDNIHKKILKNVVLYINDILELDKLQKQKIKEKKEDGFGKLLHFFGISEEKKRYAFIRETARLEKRYKLLKIKDLEWSIECTEFIEHLLDKIYDLKDLKYYLLSSTIYGSGDSVGVLSIISRLFFNCSNYDNVCKFKKILCDAACYYKKLSSSEEVSDTSVESFKALVKNYIQRELLVEIQEFSCIYKSEYIIYSACFSGEGSLRLRPICVFVRTLCAVFDKAIRCNNDSEKIEANEVCNIFIIFLGMLEIQKPEYFVCNDEGSKYLGIGYLYKNVFVKSIGKTCLVHSYNDFIKNLIDIASNYGFVKVVECLSKACELEKIKDKIHIPSESIDEETRFNHLVSSRRSSIEADAEVVRQDKIHIPSESIDEETRFNHLVSSRRSSIEADAEVARQDKIHIPSEQIDEETRVNHLVSSRRSSIEAEAKVARQDKIHIPSEQIDEETHVNHLVSSRRSSIEADAEVVRQDKIHIPSEQIDEETRVNHLVSSRRSSIEAEAKVARQDKIHIPSEQIDEETHVNHLVSSRRSSIEADAEVVRQDKIHIPSEQIDEETRVNHLVSSRRSSIEAEAKVVRQDKIHIPSEQIDEETRFNEVSRKKDHKMMTHKPVNQLYGKQLYKPVNEECPVKKLVNPQKHCQQLINPKKPCNQLDKVNKSADFMENLKKKLNHMVSANNHNDVVPYNSNVDNASKNVDNASKKFVDNKSNKFHQSDNDTSFDNFFMPEFKDFVDYDSEEEIDTSKEDNSANVSGKLAINHPLNTTSIMNVGNYDRENFLQTNKR